MQVLGQIDAPLSSKVLALMAVYGKSPEVRGRATEMIRRRPDEDYLELLVDLMVDPLKYEVKPVGGPGSPGVLFVEGERFNTKRFYAAPPPAEHDTDAGRYHHVRPVRDAGPHAALYPREAAGPASRVQRRWRTSSTAGSGSPPART